MAHYPKRADIGGVDIDSLADIRALMEMDAAGKIKYDTRSRGAEVNLGDIWIELCADEPQYRNKVIPVLDAFVKDSDDRLRHFALVVMPHVTAPSHPRALREAFEREPKLFVGVALPDSWSGQTLFNEWLSALVSNFGQDPDETRRAAALAQPFLSLPEAGSYSVLLPVAIGQPATQWAPAVFSSASADQLTTMMYQVPRTQLTNIASALRGLDEGTRQRFASAVRVRHADDGELCQQVMSALDLP